MSNLSKNTNASMFPVIRQFISSDISQREFCQANQISYHCFQYWLKKFRNELDSKDKPSFSTIEIERPSSQRHILIRTSEGVEIQIPV